MKVSALLNVTQLPSPIDLAAPNSALFFYYRLTDGGNGTQMVGTGQYKPFPEIKNSN